MPLTNEQKMLIEFVKLHAEYDASMVILNALPSGQAQLDLSTRVLSMHHDKLCAFEDKWSAIVKEPLDKSEAIAYHDKIVAEGITEIVERFKKNFPSGPSAIPAGKSNNTIN